MQTRKRSVIEAVTNVTVGYIVAILSQELVFPLFGIRIPLTEHLTIGGMFTGISLIRSYLLRRAFNKWDGPN